MKRKLNSSRTEPSADFVMLMLAVAPPPPPSKAAVHLQSARRRRRRGGGPFTHTICKQGKSRRVDVDSDCIENAPPPPFTFSVCPSTERRWRRALQSSWRAISKQKPFLNTQHVLGRAETLTPPGRRSVYWPLRPNCGQMLQNAQRQRILTKHQIILISVCGNLSFWGFKCKKRKPVDFVIQFVLKVWKYMFQAFMLGLKCHKKHIKNQNHLAHAAQCLHFRDNWKIKMKNWSVYSSSFSKTWFIKAGLCRNNTLISREKVSYPTNS